MLKPMDYMQKISRKLRGLDKPPPSDGPQLDHYYDREGNKRPTHAPLDRAPAPNEATSKDTKL